MIDEEKIGMAASKYAKEAWNFEEEQFSCMDGFREGVRWAQEEFTNSLWHDASEEPKMKAQVIVESQIPDNSSLAYTLDGNYGCWSAKVKACGYVQWCYLDDILPKIGGENG